MGLCNPHKQPTSSHSAICHVRREQDTQPEFVAGLLCEPRVLVLSILVMLTLYGFTALRLLQLHHGVFS